MKRERINQPPAETMHCQNCGGKFETLRKWQRFCSESCRYEKWNKENPRIRAVNR